MPLRWSLGGMEKGLSGYNYKHGAPLELWERGLAETWAANRPPRCSAGAWGMEKGLSGYKHGAPLELWERGWSGMWDANLPPLALQVPDGRRGEWRPLLHPKAPSPLPLCRPLEGA